jgi:hypothetical protein
MEVLVYSFLLIGTLGIIRYFFRELLVSQNNSNILLRFKTIFGFLIRFVSS